MPITSLEMAKCLKNTLSRRDFNLIKFFSNVPGAIDAYPKAETKTLHLDQQPLNTKRTLGLEWDSESDCFVLAVEGWQGDSTRRSLLSYVASVFDPLGLVAPCVLPSKLLIQDLTRRKADWDETMTNLIINTNKSLSITIFKVQILEISGLSFGLYFYY